GRAAELTTLRQAFDDARRGAVAVRVCGESGVGKTALVRAFVDSLPGQSVLFGRCYEQESLPFKAFDGVVDALCQKLRALPAQAARELLPPEAPLLLRLFAQLSRVPAVAELPPPPDPVTNPVQLRSRAFAAFREVLRRLAE